MLNKKGERELAYIVEINDIQPIEGADRVELAYISGWKVMVKKGQFKKGDLAVYFEIDSKVPETPEFEFLAQKGYKIKTQKYFKGTVISQGLIMGLEDLPSCFEEAGLGNYRYIGTNKMVCLGDFLTSLLNIKYSVEEDNRRKEGSADKYKKMVQRHGKLFAKQPFRWLMKRTWGKKLLFIFFGKKRDKKTAWPSWVSKTDEERIQNIPYILQDKQPWIATEKIDGTSTTITLRKHGNNKKKWDYYVCSRNVVFEKYDQKNFYDGNVYIDMAEKYNVRHVLEELIERYNLEWVTLQGETFGNKIQKRDYGMTDVDFVGFNLIFSDRGRLNSVESAELMKEFGINWVPIIDVGFILPDTVDELLQIAEGKSMIDGGMREGLVFRSADGVKSFKAVSNAFLLKYHQ